jgi:hypothetical protein
MTPGNDNDAGSTPRDGREFEQDPTNRVGYYSYAKMSIYFNGRPAEDASYDFSCVESQSVAEDIARIVEVYVLASAETNFRGELTFKISLPPPTKNPRFIAWECGPSW